MLTRIAYLLAVWTLVPIAMVLRVPVSQSPQSAAPATLYVGAGASHTVYKVVGSGMTPVVTELPGWADSVLFLSPTQMLITIPDVQKTGHGWYIVLANPTNGADKIVAGGASNAGISGPYDMTVGPDGHTVYVSFKTLGTEGYLAKLDTTTWKVKKMPPLPNPDGIIFPSGGGLYVTSHSAGKLLRVDPVSGFVIGSWLMPHADGLAPVPDQQAIYVAGGSVIYAFDLQKQAFTIVAEGFPVDSHGHGVDGLTVDETGSLYAADASRGHGGIYAVSVNSHQKIKLVGPPPGGSVWDDLSPLFGRGAAPTSTPTPTPPAQDTPTPTATPTPTWRGSVVPDPATLTPTPTRTPGA